MRVIFRVDASLEIGSGHVMRCLAIAEILQKNGANVQFITRKHKGHLISNIISKGFDVFELESYTASNFDDKLYHSNWLGSTQKQDATDCLNIINENKVDWLIVDHYGIDEDWQKCLKSSCQKLMVIDDLADRKHQCDMLLDQTFGRQKKDYKGLVPDNCELIVGSEYALLRPEFKKWRQYSLDRRKNPTFKELLINLGGIDSQNITEQVLEILSKCNLPKNINITIVMGASAPHLKAVKLKASSLPYKTDFKINVSNMAEIMANSDIAIGASGSSTWERCCLGLPSIQIVIADNQVFLAEVLAKNNIIKLTKDNLEIKELLESSANWMGDLSFSSKNICKGLGVYKVFNKLANYKIRFNEFEEVNLINYVNLSIEDKLLVLKMRNHVKVKSFMYNDNNITESSHLNFIDSLEDCSDKRYFLIKLHQKVIGAINFHKINLNNSVEFGLYTNPFIQLKGAGKILDGIATQFAFFELGVYRIKLEVLVENIRALNFYYACGYKLIQTKKFNNKDIFCMEKLNLMGVLNE